MSEVAIQPKPAASMAVFRDGMVLIVQRGKGGMIGKWSLPGGHVEPGETARAAAEREVGEETGVGVRLIGLTDVHDVIIRAEDGRLRAHYVLSVFHGHWVSGEPKAASDVADARFVTLAELEAYDLTPGAADLVRRSWRLIAGATQS